VEGAGRHRLVWVKVLQVIYAQVPQLLELAARALGPPGGGGSLQREVVVKVVVVGQAPLLARTAAGLGARLALRCLGFGPLQAAATNHGTHGRQGEAHDGQCCGARRLASVDHRRRRRVAGLLGRRLELDDWLLSHRHSRRLACGQLDLLNCAGSASTAGRSFALWGSRLGGRHCRHCRDWLVPLLHSQLVWRLYLGLDRRGSHFQLELEGLGGRWLEGLCSAGRRLRDGWPLLARST
jgi:hypothetical protein